MIRVILTKIFNRSGIAVQWNGGGGGVKAMDGLFKYNGNRARFSRASGVISNCSVHSTCIREKWHVIRKPLFLKMSLLKVDSAFAQ